MPVCVGPLRGGHVACGISHMFAHRVLLHGALARQVPGTLLGKPALTGTVAPRGLTAPGSRGRGHSRASAGSGVLGPPLSPASPGRVPCSAVGHQGGRVP